MHNTLGGLCLLVVGGVMNASFSLPMKFARAWAWENTWLLWSFFALLVLPTAIAWITVPSLGFILASHRRDVVWVAVFGAAWGVAQVLFGQALEKIGIALTFSIVLGLSAAMGSVVPLLQQHYDQLFTRDGIVALGGVALVLLGVAASGVAGRMRDRAKEIDGTANPHFTAGMVMAIASGVCASMMNVGFSHGESLASAAAALGTGRLWTTNIIWMPLLAGGAIPSVVYCIYLLGRNSTTQRYNSPDSGRNVLLAFAMSVLWFGSSILYGVATVFLGKLGPVVGWPLFMSLIVIVASLLSVWTGEWRGARRAALQMQVFAVTILVGAVVVLSRATF
jgi:L-rhamnose-H+ transport protein